MKKVSVLFIASLIVLGMSSYAQTDGGVSIGKGNNPANTKSILELVSKTKGLLIPRMTDKERNAIFSGTDHSAKGLIVFDDTQNAFYFWDGTAWNPVASGNMQTVAGTPTIPGVAGDLTLDTQNSLLYIYNAGKWVRVSGGNTILETKWDGRVLQLGSQDGKAVSVSMDDLLKTIPASDVKVIPNTTLGLSSGNVQDALMELQGEIKTASGGGMNSVVHDGSLVGNGTTGFELKVAPGGIAGSHLAAGAIISTNLAADAVTTAKLADGAVTAAKIMGGGKDKVLTTNVYGTVEWIDKSSVSEFVGISAVVHDKTLTGIGTSALPLGLAINSITTNEIVNETIKAEDLHRMDAGDGYFLQYKLGTGWAARAVQYNATITGIGTDISPLGLADNAVTSAKIADGSVSSTKITDGAVTSTKIADKAVSAANLSQMGATSGQVLQWDGSIWKPGTVVPGTGGGASIYVDPAFLTGNGTAASQLGLADGAVTSVKLAAKAVLAGNLSQMGATSGQVLQWDGSIWKPGTVVPGTGGLASIYVDPAFLTGNGTNALPLGLADGAVTSVKLAAKAVLSGNLSQMGATFGQVLQWNGSTWAATTPLVTDADKTKLDAITGTNSGDETASTILNKLGATALTGTNTGDQKLSLAGNNLTISGTGGNSVDLSGLTGGGGGITAVSVATTNGFGGTSDGNVTNPTITLRTPLSGLLKGNGTAMFVAVGGTDYLRPTDNAPTATNIAGGSSGELLYQSAAGTTTTLSKGVASQVLTMNSAATLPIWATPAATGLNIVAVTNNNGITASVANAVPTSTITLGLGAITPTSVSTGAVTATSLKITTDASNGYVLKSDAAGNATWKAPTSSYKGMWDASINTPAIANGAGAIGDYYIVSVGGTTLTPATTFTQGGQAVYSGAVWQSVSASVVETDPIVKAINGIVYSDGTTISAITLGTNLSFTGTTLDAVGVTTDGSSLPLTASPGDVFYNTTTKGMYYYKDTEWVPVSSTPKGNTLPTVAESKVGDVFYFTNADTSQNTLKIFDGTSWVTVGITNGSITDMKMQGAGGSTLTGGSSGQLLGSAGNNQFKWINSGSTPSGSTLPAVEPSGSTFYNTTTQTFWVSDGTSWAPAGTVTSIGLALPSFMSVTNSPVTTTGVLTGTLVTQTAGTVFSAPSGATGIPTFRTLQDSDVPGLANKVNVSAVGAVLGVAPLDASQKVPSVYLPDAILGSVTYKGTYDAGTGLPTLPTASASNKGFYYVVNTAGSVPLSLNVGDWVISNGTLWEKVNNSSGVSTIFGRAGSVIANVGDYNTDLVTEGSTNKYYSNTLADLNPTLTGKEDISNKENSIIADATYTKYPTVDAVKNYVDAKVPVGGSAGQVLTMVSGNPAWSAPDVSSVSVTTANGISGTVANATMTPAITLTLGAITPSSVTTSGAVTASTITGSLNASNLTGTIATARYGTNTIPITAINGTGTTPAAGTYLDGSGKWSVPSGGASSLPTISGSDANKVLTVNSLATASTWEAPGSTTVPIATTSSKGVLKLAGDLVGTADAPTVQSVGGIFPNVNVAANTLVIRDLAGLINGGLQGNAATATFATTAGTVTSAAQPVITSLGTLTNLSVLNPIVGNITGNAATATTATTAITSTKVTITNVSSGATVYPTWVTAEGDVPLNINTTKLKYVPSTGEFSATTFNGALNAINLTGTIAKARYGIDQIPLAALNAGTVNTSAFLKGDGTWAIPLLGSGTVTSVGLTLPSIFSISNSPVTTSGSLTAALASQIKNTVLAAPGGADGTPTFRTLSGADISDFATKVDVSTIGTANGIVPLDGSSKIAASYLPSSVTGAVNYKGTYNAATGGDPILPSALGSQGFYYVVNVAGNNPMTLAQGDWIISNGTIWDRVANGGTVSSVFTRTGAIEAIAGDYTTDKVTEGTKKYYSDALVSANATVVGKEDKSNITTDGTLTAVTNTQYPSALAVKTYVDAKVPATGGNGQVLTVVSGTPGWQTPSAGSGTVSSVGLSLPPSIFTVINSPVLSAGTLTGTLASQSTGTFFAAPSGSAGSPSFRAILASDVPLLNQNTTGSATTATTAVTITGATQSAITSVGTLTGLTVTANINGSITGTAAIASKTTITDDLGTNSTVYPTWVSSNTGNLPQKVTSSRLSFVPSTGVLTATSFRGNLTATDISSGLVPVVRLGTGTANATTFLKGDGTWGTASGSGSDATASSKGILMLANDLGGTAATPLVLNVGGSTAAAINSATVLVGNAKTAADPNSLVLRDASGDILNLNASKLTTGTVLIARLGSSGVASNSTFLRGDGVWAAPTGGTGTTATNLNYTPSPNDGVVTSSTGASATIPAGSTSDASLMLPADKSKLNKIADLAGTADANKVLTANTSGTAAIWVAPASGGATDLTYTASPTQGLVNSSTGASAAIPAATITNAGLLLPADKTKLDNIAAGGGGGSSLQVYHPGGNSAVTVRATGLGIGLTMKAGFKSDGAASNFSNLFEITVPTGVFLQSLQIVGDNTTLGDAAGTTAYMNVYIIYADNINNDYTDAQLPVYVNMFDRVSTSNKLRVLPVLSQTSMLIDEPANHTLKMFINMNYKKWAFALGF